MPLPDVDLFQQGFDAVVVGVLLGYFLADAQGVQQQVLLHVALGGLQHGLDVLAQVLGGGRVQGVGDLARGPQHGAALLARRALARLAALHGLLQEGLPALVFLFLQLARWRRVPCGQRLRPVLGRWPQRCAGRGLRLPPPFSWCWSFASLSSKRRRSVSNWAFICSVVLAVTSAHAASPSPSASSPSCGAAAPPHGGARAPAHCPARGGGLRARCAGALPSAPGRRPWPWTPPRS